MMMAVCGGVCGRASSYTLRNFIRRYRFSEIMNYLFHFRIQYRLSSLSTLSEKDYEFLRFQKAAGTDNIPVKL